MTRLARASAIGAVVGLIAVLVGLGFVRQHDGGPVRFEGNLGPGGRIQQLTLPSLHGEIGFDWAASSDRHLVINFFASWCPSCIAEMPDFERVHRTIGDEVRFVGVSQRDAREASIDLARRTGITYETAVDQQGRFFDAVGGLGMPTTVFVRRGGEIADVWVGALNEQTLRDLVLEHFGVSASSS